MQKYLILFLLLPLLAGAQTKQSPKNIVDLIKQNVTCKWEDKTVDTFKAGDPDNEIKGIAVCMFADMKTLKTAVKLGCNFIITHEPIFYNHLDETAMYKQDEIYNEKLSYIKDNNLTVFRFHDHIHRTKPDGIYVGMINKLEWNDYAQNERGTHFVLPETNLADLVKDIKQKLGLKTVRVIGKPDMKFTKVGLAVGAPGGQTHIQMLSQPNVEVMVAGEAPEWESYLYANDAVSLGKNKAIVFLGHIKSEEAGMEYCAKWLSGFVKDIPIHFIENQLNFTDL